MTISHLIVLIITISAVIGSNLCNFSNIHDSIKTLIAFRVLVNLTDKERTNLFNLKPLSSWISKLDMKFRKESFQSVKRYFKILSSSSRYEYIFENLSSAITSPLFRSNDSTEFKEQLKDFLQCFAKCDVEDLIDHLIYEIFDAITVIKKQGIANVDNCILESFCSFFHHPININSFYTEYLAGKVDLGYFYFDTTKDVDSVIFCSKLLVSLDLEDSQQPIILPSLQKYVLASQSTLYLNIFLTSNFYPISMFIGLENSFNRIELSVMPFENPHFVVHFWNHLCNTNSDSFKEISLFNLDFDQMATMELLENLGNIKKLERVELINYITADYHIPKVENTNRLNGVVNYKYLQLLLQLYQQDMKYFLNLKSVLVPKKLKRWIPNNYTIKCIFKNVIDRNTVRLVEFIEIELKRQ